MGKWRKNIFKTTNSMSTSSSNTNKRRTTNNKDDKADVCFNNAYTFSSL